MKKLLVLSMTLLLGQLIYSQDKPLLRHSLGVAATGTAGSGFSYRYFPDKFGVQVTAIPIFNGSENMFISSGVSFLYRIRSHERLDVFTYLSNSILYSKREYTYFNYEGGYWDPNVEYEETTFTESYTNYNIGLGAGVNISLWDFLDLSLNAGYGLYQVNSKFRNTTFDGGIGLYYKF